MRCVVNISVSNNLREMIGGITELIIRVDGENHFVSADISHVWEDRNFAFGQLHCLSDITTPAVGDIIGMNESDIRGWIAIFD